MVPIVTDSSVWNATVPLALQIKASIERQGFITHALEKALPAGSAFAVVYIIKKIHMEKRTGRKLNGFCRGRRKGQEKAKNAATARENAIERDGSISHR